MNRFVIIPAYNEERSIGAVVRCVLANKTIQRCVVVDDGSTDNSARAARGAGATVIRRVNNSGTGTAIKIGLHYAVREKADFVLLMDADGQHDPRYIPALIKAVDERADYVIASRYLCPGEHVTVFARRLGTKIIAHAFRLLNGHYISDPTSGFRAMNKKTLFYLAHRFPTTFNEPEAAIAALEQRFSIKEIPCKMKPRLYGASSISAIKAVFLMMYILTKMVYRKIRASL